MTALDETLKYISRCDQLGHFAPPSLVNTSETAAIVEKLNLTSDVLTKLVDLDGRIETLVQKLTDDYDSLDVLMAKNKFYTDIIQTLLTMTKFVQDTLFFPSKESFNLLLEVYQKNDPLREVVQMISFMNIAGSNPIKVAMAADPKKSPTTFAKWRDIVDGILQHFLFLESYIKRLVFGEDNTDAENLKKLIEDLEKKYPEWEDEYPTNPFSPDLKQIVEHVQDMTTTNEIRSDILIDYLKKNFPRDSFNVLVFNEATTTSDYAFYALDGKMEKYFRTGKCSIVITRSKDVQIYTAEEMRDLRRGIKGVTTIDAAIESLPQLYMTAFNKTFGEKHGSVGLIRETQNLALRVAQVGYGKTPGWGLKVSQKAADGVAYPYTLFATYK